MKALPWIIAGVSAGAALAYVMLNGLRPQAETGWDSVEDAANRTRAWGGKASLAGVGTRVGGKLKEGLGRVLGDSDLADEGMGDQAVGALQSGAGKLAHAVGDTIHDLNR